MSASSASEKPSPESETSTEIIVVYHEPGTPLPETDTDWDRVMAMTDEEIHQAALDDPDNPPLETIRQHLRRLVNPLRLRKRLGLSQEEFADRYGIPLALIQDWETVRKRPDRVAYALLEAIDKEPETMARLLSRAA